MSIKEYLKEETDEMVFEEMTGAEIGRELGITRQAVSNTLKRALGKIYNELLKQHKDWTPLDAAVSIALYLDRGEEDMKKFFKLFPPKIRKEIEADAATRMPKPKK